MMSPEAFVHYKTHNEQLDAEHWELFSLMCNVIIELKAGKNEEAVPHIVVLLDAFKKHIETETKMMEDAQYPYRAHHCEDHGKMFNVVKDISRCIAEKQYIDEWTISKMQTLFTTHVDYHDIQMADWIAKNRKTNG
jgi:hemerythrin-like metal-binding protein